MKFISNVKGPIGYETICDNWKPFKNYTKYFISW